MTAYCVRLFFDTAYGIIMGLGHLLFWQMILYSGDPRYQAMGWFAVVLTGGFSLWFLWRFYDSERADGTLGKDVGRKLCQTVVFWLLLATVCVSVYRLTHDEVVIGLVGIGVAGGVSLIIRAVYRAHIRFAPQPLPQQ